MNPICLLPQHTSKAIRCFSLLLAWDKLRLLTANMLSIPIIIVFLFPFLSFGQRYRSAEEVEAQWQAYLNQTRWVLPECTIKSARNVSIEVRDFVYSASPDSSTYSYRFSLYNPANGEITACNTTTNKPFGAMTTTICARESLPKRWSFNWETRTLFAASSWRCEQSWFGA